MTRIQPHLFKFDSKPELMAILAVVVAIVFVSSPLISRANPAVERPLCTNEDRDIQIVIRSHPSYPLAASLLCVEGSVQVEFLIDSSGRTSEITSLEGTPTDIFDQAAIEAVETWRFLPRCIDGEAVSRTALQRIDFVLPPAQKATCPNTISDEVMEATISIAALYSLVAREVLMTEQWPTDLPPLSPTLSGELALIEQLHIDQIDRELQRQQEFSQRMAEFERHRLLDAERIEQDVTFAESQAMLAGIRSAAQAYVEDIETSNQRAMARAETLRANSGLDDDEWMFLVGRFFDPDWQHDQLEALRRDQAYSFAKAEALLELLHTNRQAWRPDPARPFRPMFFNDEFRQRAVDQHAQTKAAFEALETKHLEWLLVWSDL